MQKAIDHHSHDLPNPTTLKNPLYKLERLRECGQVKFFAGKRRATEQQSELLNFL